VKVQLKFDQKQMKEFFLENVEKIVFGIMVLCFLVFAYQSVMLKGYGQRPDNLQTAVRAANGIIDRDGQTPPTYDDFATIVQRSRDYIDDQRYATVWPWYRLPSPPNQPRPMPDVLAVRDLHGAAGRGGIITSEEGAEGRRWIVVVGAVPLEKQTAEFKRCFQDATHRDAQSDVPHYAGFIIQRAEIDPLAPNKPPEWTKTFTQKTMLAAAKTWGQSVAEDVVDPKYCLRSLCSPLPSLAEQTWGREAACSPEIPSLLGDDEEAATNKDDEAAPKSKDEADADTDEVDKPAPVARQPRQTPRRGGGFNALAALHGRTSPTGKGASPQNWNQPDGANDAEPTSEWLLFRFLDFDVEPGKQYRYRVFPLLKNPNRGVLARHLVKPDDAKLAYIGQVAPPKATDKNTELTIDEASAKWSKPTDAITVPEDIDILAASVTTPRAGAEPTGKIQIKQWMPASGSSASNEFTVVRGKVLDFEGLPGEDTGSSDEPSTLDYKTGEIVLDITGGDKLGTRDRNLFRLGQFLTMDKTGKITIRDELGSHALTQEGDTSDKDSTEADEDAAPARTPRRTRNSNVNEEFEKMAPGGIPIPANRIPGRVRKK